VVKPASSVALACATARAVPQREAFVEDLIVPARLVIGVQEEVTVALDHAGHEGRPGKVDHLRTGGRREVGAGGGDPVALHQHLPAGMDLASVEHAVGLEQDRRGGVGDRGRGHRQQSHHPAHAKAPFPSPSPLRRQGPIFLTQSETPRG